ncbi:Na+/H+ antiporter NhaA [Streptomyces calidiresistens]|uniref:Na(+)/H(+) antiporter NhaA n=1 Tax=Streptomyces calidiresistens TaxID=1485586 RepID=A0A7W3T809_9ACTN|nr:Na+/H+ antiporter NhaA [Streptomyces calidiresistens]MBB0232649.1 Na+/H+ antiporter NhaA [Streptomyces calidiresistens]
MTPPSAPSPDLPGEYRERDRRSIAEFLRLEVSGGLMLLIAASLALILANSPLGDGYASVRDHYLGFSELGLRMSIGHWAADGLLAVFFFIVGIELKREMVVGELRNPVAAILPIVAAVGGMAVPAIFYAVVVGAQGGNMDGWAVPMATDIAFALGVLAVVGRNLPSALRTFLLTLAIVDDLIAITVIAIFYTSNLNFLALFGSFVGLGVFWFLHHRGVRGWYIYVPLALVIWALMFNSGVHATIAGVAIGMLLRSTPREGEKHSPAEHIEHIVHPWSAGLAVPVFALFAAGVAISAETITGLPQQPEALGVVLGLFLGKIVGIFGASWVMVKLTRVNLNPALKWADIAGASMLAGIGFTVSLLIAELAFTEDMALQENVKAAVLLASLLAAVGASIVLGMRNRQHVASGGSGGSDIGEPPAVRADDDGSSGAAAAPGASDSGTGGDTGVPARSGS